MDIKMITMKKNICKIDLHAHILPIDHGSSCNEETEYMFKQAKEYGVDKIVCTSHYYSENYKEKFNEIALLAKNYGIRLYKGNEIMIYDIEDIFDYKTNSLNNTNYYLIEIERNNKIPFCNIKTKLLSLLNNNKKIVFAHPELVGLSIKQVRELKEMGILIQIDAYSYFLKNKKMIKALLNKNLVDIVASDVHYGNDGYNYLDKMYNLVFEKYGELKAFELFYDNPRKILYNKELKRN